MGYSFYTCIRCRFLRYAISHSQPWDDLALAFAVQAGQLRAQQPQQPTIRCQHQARHIHGSGAHPSLAALQRSVHYSPMAVAALPPPCIAETAATLHIIFLKPLIWLLGRRALSSLDELACGEHTHAHAARTGHLSNPPTPVPLATPATGARRLPGAAPPRLACPPLQPPQAQQSGCMLDAVTPLGPAARATRQLNDAEAQRDRWDTALRLLAEDEDENVVCFLDDCMACQYPIFCR